MVPESGKMLTICGIRKDAGGGKLSSWNRINISGFPRSSPLDPALPPRVPPASLKLGWGGGGGRGGRQSRFLLSSFFHQLSQRKRTRETRGILRASFRLTALTAAIGTDSSQNPLPTSPVLRPWSPWTKHGLLVISACASGIPSRKGRRTTQVPPTWLVISSVVELEKQTNNNSSNNNTFVQRVVLICMHVL